MKLLKILLLFLISTSLYAQEYFITPKSIPDLNIDTAKVNQIVLGNFGSTPITTTGGANLSTLGLTGNITGTSLKIIGGTATTSDLFFQTTTANSTTGADMHFLVGNNGGTEAMTILRTGLVGIGTNNPVSKLQIGADWVGASQLSIQAVSTEARHGIVCKINNTSYWGLIFSNANSNNDMLVSGGLATGMALNVKAGGVDGSLCVLTNGNVGINKTDPNERLDVNGNIIATQYKLSTLNTAPATSTSTGTVGEIRIDANYIYICVATNTWKRVALNETTW